LNQIINDSGIPLDSTRSEFALAAGGDEAKRAFDAMMGMKKIDVAAITAARRG
jgi:hypothetical protein